MLQWMIKNYILGYHVLLFQLLPFQDPPFIILKIKSGSFYDN